MCKKRLLMSIFCTSLPALLCYLSHDLCSFYTYMCTRSTRCSSRPHLRHPAVCVSARAALSLLAVDTARAAGPSPEIVPLPASFPSRYGVQVLSAVDVAIFGGRYFTHCMQCSFCRDACCSEGVDVDLLHLHALEAHADGLEARTGVPRDRWFTQQRSYDPEMPGGGAVRTQVVDGACVFRDRRGRGCLVHAYCLERGLD